MQLPTPNSTTPKRTPKFQLPILNQAALGGWTFGNWDSFWELGVGVLELTQLQRTPDPLLKLFAIAAAEREARPVLQEDHVLAVEPGLQLSYAFDVDDVGAVDAVEGVGVELRLERVHRFPEQMCVGADVQLDVIARRFDPVDFVRADEEHASTGLDHESLETV